MNDALHIPVLLDETIAALAPRDGAVYVDGTFGAGGYSLALLAAARCRVIAIDRDPAAVARGDGLMGEHASRFTVIEGRFGEMEALLAPLGISAVAGIIIAHSRIAPSRPAVSRRQALPRARATRSFTSAIARAVMAWPAPRLPRAT